MRYEVKIFFVRVKSVSCAKWKPAPRSGEILLLKGIFIHRTREKLHWVFFPLTKHPWSSVPTVVILILGVSFGTPVNHFNTQRRQLCSLQVQLWDISGKKERDKQYKESTLWLHVFSFLWLQRNKIALGQLSWGLRSPPQHILIPPSELLQGTSCLRMQENTGTVTHARDRRDV